MATKTWFITGTSRGFGREWTKAALERGDRVAATARDTSALDDLRSEHGDALLALTLDVTDREAAFGAVAHAHEHFGALDIVVNNAGYSHFGMVEEISEQEARAQIETNLFGALWVTQAALPLLREQGQRPHHSGVVDRRHLGVPERWHLPRLQVGAGGGQSGTCPGGQGVRDQRHARRAGWPLDDWSGPSAKRSEPYSAYDGLRERQQQWRASNVPGDPTASALAIMRVVDADPPPLRVFFGTAPLGIAENDYEGRLATWREWQPVAVLAQGGGQ